MYVRLTLATLLDEAVSFRYLAWPSMSARPPSKLKVSPPSISSFPTFEENVFSESISHCWLLASLSLMKSSLLKLSSFHNVKPGKRLSVLRSYKEPNRNWGRIASKVITFFELNLFRNPFSAPSSGFILNSKSTLWEMVKRHSINVPFDKEIMFIRKRETF